MSMSKAKKERLKQVREGKRNPELNRGSWYGINPHERNTPTLTEAKRKSENKHKRKWNSSPYSDSSIFVFVHPFNWNK
jgi:hypothetical protein